MEIRTESQGSTTFLYLLGRFDAHTTQLFHSKTLDIQGRLIIDLTQVNFIDSRGLAALIGLYHRLGTLLTLRAPQDAVRLIFEITRLDQVFIFEQS